MKAPYLAALLMAGSLFSHVATADVVEGVVPHEDDLLSVRFRSFGNTGGGEVYLGVPDLGVGANREEINLNWSDADFPFTLTLDRPNDTLTIEIAGRTLTYDQVSSRIASIKPDSPYSIFDLNLLQIDIAQRDAGATVQLLDMTLNGDDLGDFLPSNDGFFTWTATGTCIAAPPVAEVSGTLRLQGPFGRSQELSRVELRAGVIARDGLDCVRNPRPDDPGVFINGFEPLFEEPGQNAVQLNPLPGQCTASPWNAITGSAQALGVATAPVGRTYEQDCSLTVDSSAPGFVTTEAPVAEPLVATRFYFYANEVDLAGGDAVIFTARDGDTVQAQLALRQVGDHQHLVVSYRSGGSLVEHGATFRTLPVWQAATVIWAAGDGDGRLVVKLDGRTELELTDLSNVNERVNELDMGLVDAPEGASGPALFDAFHARRALPEPDLLRIDEVVNFSTRAAVGTGDAVVPGGFIIVGDTPKCLVLRGRGPSLPVPGQPLVQDPNLTLVRQSDRQVVDTNDDWADHADAALVQRLAPASLAAKDAAMLTCLDPGAYTVVLRGAGDEAPALGIVEVVDVDQGSAHLFNISTRARASTGAARIIGGFIVTGEAPRTLLIRGRGPSVLVDGATLLDDPVMQLFDGSTVIADNDDWQAAPNATAISATGRAPGSELDAAILVTLDPGPYTVFLESRNGNEGIGIIEVLDINGPDMEPNE